MTALATDLTCPPTDGHPSHLVALQMRAAALAGIDVTDALPSPAELAVLVRRRAHAEVG